MAAPPSPTSLPLEVAEQVCRRLIFLQSNTGEMIEAPDFIEEFSATVRNMLAHKSGMSSFILSNSPLYASVSRNRLVP